MNNAEIIREFIENGSRLDVGPYHRGAERRSSDQRAMRLPITRR